jgi:hypothetical protein
MARLSTFLFLAAAAFAASSPHASGAAGQGEVLLAGYVHDFDAGVAIGGETDPYGWVLSPSRVNRPVVLPRIAYLDAGTSGVSLADLAGRWCVIRGVLEEDALHAGGVETPARSFDLLTVVEVRSAAAPRKLIEKLPGRLLADLERRGVSFSRDGTAVPHPPLDPVGWIDGKRPALQVPLVVPPPDSADMYTDTAFVDRRGGRYWALRTGGFMAVTQWVGPFRLPRPRGR